MGEDFDSKIIKEDVSSKIFQQRQCVICEKNIFIITKFMREREIKCSNISNTFMNTYFKVFYQNISMTIKVFLDLSKKIVDLNSTMNHLVE